MMPHIDKYASNFTSLTFMLNNILPNSNLKNIIFQYYISHIISCKDSYIFI